MRGRGNKSVRKSVNSRKMKKRSKNKVGSLANRSEINEEMYEGYLYKIEGRSNKNKMKRKTRNNQNKRDLLNYPFVLSSHIYFFSLLTLFSLISVV
jgi:hypothetical protein